METYELIVENESNIIRKGNGKTETYSLLVEPSAQSSLVLESRQNILQTIQLDELFDNLDNCVSLLDITYNAVNGTGLSEMVVTLKDQFSNTLDDSLVVMEGFKTGTKASITDFITAYQYLTSPLYKKAKKNGVSMAIERLSTVTMRAEKMEKEAQDLAMTFDNIEKEAQAITRRIMEARDTDVQKKKEIDNKLNVLQAQVSALNDVKESLDDEITEYGEQYNKLAKQIEKNEKRAFTLSIVSAVMGGVATMFGGGALSMTNPTQSQTGETAQPTEGSGERLKKYEENEMKVQELKKRIAEYDKALEEVKQQIAVETVVENKKQLSDKQDQLIRDKAQAQKELDEAQGKMEVLKAALSGISDGLGKTSGELNKMAEKMDEKNVTQYERLDRISAQKAAVQKERRNTLQKLSEMTSEIENASAETRDLEMCISALITAIGAMKIVKVYLSDIALFWNNVARFCTNLTESVSNLNEEIQNFTEVEDYCIIFKDPIFVNAFLLNMVNWAGLHMVSKEYLAAFYKSREKYQMLEKQGEFAPEKHWAMAKESARVLNIKLKQEAGER